MTRKLLPSESTGWTPGGGGGTPDFKSREWSNEGKTRNPKKSLGLQTKPKKFPGPKANPQKIPWLISKPSKFPESRRGYNTPQKKAAKIRGYYQDTTNLQIVLNMQTNPHLNQATQKNTCQIFLPKTKSRNLKIQTSPKNRSIIPVTWTPEYPPPPGWGLNKPCLKDILLRKTHKPKNYTGKWILKKCFTAPFVVLNSC